MTARTGPFWDGVQGRAPMPNAAATLGLEILAVDEDHGIIELASTAPDTWTNPAGNVLGDFVAAMLHDTVGPALLATVEPDQWSGWSVHAASVVAGAGSVCRRRRQRDQSRPRRSPGNTS